MWFQAVEYAVCCTAVRVKYQVYFLLMLQKDHELLRTHQISDVALQQQCGLYSVAIPLFYPTQ